MKQAKRNSETGKMYTQFFTSAGECISDFNMSMMENYLKGPENVMKLSICMYDSTSEFWSNYCDHAISYLRNLEK